MTGCVASEVLALQAAQEAAEFCRTVFWLADTLLNCEERLRRRSPGGSTSAKARCSQQALFC